MPTIDDILNGLGADDTGSEKTANAKSTPAESDVEKQAKALGLIDDKTTKVASTQSGGKMNLNDFYNDMFGETTKIASEEGSKEEGKKEGEEEGEEKSAAALEEAGEQAGRIFAAELDSRLNDFCIKIAMDGLPDSGASQDAQKGSGVVGAKVENPQLPVNRREDADTANSMDPEYYDLEGMDGALAKARLESALAAGDVGDLSHQTHNVDSGMETPSSQKTASMKLTDLSKGELLLLNKQFPEEMMKEARAQVSVENEKLAEVAGVAEECYAYGADLAMQKIAEMEESAKEEEEKEEEEEEKTASAMGKFILEGYWNTLMEKGAEYYGDKNVYLEELVKHAGKAGMIAKLKGYASKAKGKASDAFASAKGTAKKHYGAAKKDMAAAGSAAKQVVTGQKVGPKGGKSPVDRMKALKSLGRTGTGKALAGGAVLGTGIGLGRMSKDDK